MESVRTAVCGRFLIELRFIARTAGLDQVQEALTSARRSGTDQISGEKGWTKFGLLPLFSSFMRCVGLESSGYADTK